LPSRRLCSAGGGSVLQPACLNFELADLEFLNLAREGRRELRDETDVFRDLEISNLVPAESANLLFRRRLVRRQTHPGGDNLAQPLVRDAHHLNFADLGVGIEELLNLAGIDVFAPADDDVAGAAGEAVWRPARHRSLS